MRFLKRSNIAQFNNKKYHRVTFFRKESENKECKMEICNVVNTDEKLS